MHKLFRILLRLIPIAAVACCAVWLFAPQWLHPDALRNVNAFQAAQVLKGQLDADPSKGRILLLRQDNIDQQDLFRALEATWPYAFSLRCTTRGNGLITAETLPEQLAQQQQAALLAQGIVRDVIPRGMPLRERLRTLHDYLIRHCVYDEETAERARLLTGSGADASFTAAGALVNGSAVCAGYARAYMMLCDAAGIDTVYIADAGMNHGWNAVRLYDTVYYIDTTFDDPIPDQGDKVNTDYFLLTASQLAKTHHWDTAFYNELIRYALPASLAPAQHLFDLGLLSAPPRRTALSAPLPAQDRVRLETQLGISLADSPTAEDACAAAWNALQDPARVSRLVRRGVLTSAGAQAAGLHLF